MYKDNSLKCNVSINKKQDIFNKFDVLYYDKPKNVLIFLKIL